MYPNESIGVINIDAHFDTRDEGESTSGTSFRQILEQDDNADYMVLGISQGGNTQGLFDYAKEKVYHLFMLMNYYIKYHHRLKI